MKSLNNLESLLVITPRSGISFFMNTNSGGTPRSGISFFMNTNSGGAVRLSLNYFKEALYCALTTNS